MGGFDRRRPRESASTLQPERTRPVPPKTNPPRPVTPGTNVPRAELDAPPRGDLLESLENALTPAQIARRFDVHVATVYRWMDRGVGEAKLRYLKLGGRQRRVPRADLAAFVLDTTRGARGPAPQPAKASAAAEAANAELDADGW